MNAAVTPVEAAMRLRPLVRTGLGLATLVAASAMWVAIGDRHWAATLVLGILALTCAYPAVTGRDPFDPRHRRRKHRRHRSRRHGTASGPEAHSHGDGRA
ncbi:MAG TPA: hypothetical protein VFH14_02930 [Gemmatimonadaceae bacterium]|nr:hypothetical protein [Gemmatimonadaceae bacterium]